MSERRSILFSISCHTRSSWRARGARRRAEMTFDVDSSTVVGMDLDWVTMSMYELFASRYVLNTAAISSLFCVPRRCCFSATGKTETWAMSSSTMGPFRFDMATRARSRHAVDTSDHCRRPSQ